MLNQIEETILVTNNKSLAESAKTQVNLVST